MTFRDRITLPEGYDLLLFDSLDSTNAECRRLADGGHDGDLWVVSHAQTAGRGRRGRQWTSGAGNLFASLLYRIDCDMATASQLSYVTALAVRDTLADLLQAPGRVSCKWPNDILVDQKKIAGILLETAGRGNEKLSHVIIGIGVNLMHAPEDVPYPATSVKDALGRAVEVPMVMTRLAQSMAHWTDCWRTRGFTPVRTAWKAGARGLGEAIIVRLPHEEIRGTFVDLDHSGALILEFNGERRHITAGDVFFV